MSTFLTLLFLYVFLPEGSSLTCIQCAGLPYDCIEREQKCFINQTSCISQSFTFSKNGAVEEEKTFKGCSQGLVCNETMYYDQGNRSTYSSSKCCMSDNCNTGTYYSTVPVANLFCYSCAGNSQTCAQNQTSLQCTGFQDRCMTITSMFVNGSTSNTMIKACGTGNLCNRKLEYDAGKGKLYTDISCCGKTYCNNGTSSIVVNMEPNGLQCYACNETGKGECTNNITMVSCTGNMTYCMDSQGHPKGNTLMRGCCSRDVCPGLSASMSIPAAQKLYCCTGNLCNKGVASSYFSSSLACAQRNLYLLGMALVAAIGLGILA